MPHLPGLMQLRKRARYFCRIAQIIGTVEEINIDGLQLQTTQGGVARLSNVPGGKVVTRGCFVVGLTSETNTAFGDDSGAFAHARDFAQCVAENDLSFAAAIDVSRIE